MRRAACLAAALALAVACNKASTTTTPTTTPAVVNTIQTFTGTVPVGGSAFHVFTAASSGEVDVTLTAAGPPPGIALTISVGVPTESGCAPMAGASVTAPSGDAPQLTGRVSAATLCVLVAAAGNQTDTVTYSLSVSHP